MPPFRIVADDGSQRHRRPEGGDIARGVGRATREHEPPRELEHWDWGFTRQPGSHPKEVFVQHGIADDQDRRTR